MTTNKLLLAILVSLLATAFPSSGNTADKLITFGNQAKKRMSNLLANTSSESIVNTPAAENHACSACNRPFLSDNIPPSLYAYIAGVTLAHGCLTTFLLPIIGTLLVTPLKKNNPLLTNMIMIPLCNTLTGMVPSLMIRTHCRSTATKHGYSWNWKCDASIAGISVLVTSYIAPYVQAAVFQMLKKTSKK